MATVTNTDNRRHYWPTLVDKEKGCPLSLEPGEEGEVDLPADFVSAPYLAIVPDGPPQPFVPFSVPSPAEEPLEDQE